MYLDLPGKILGIIFVKNIPNNWKKISTENQNAPLWFTERELHTKGGKTYINLNFYIPIENFITFEKVKKAILHLDLIQENQQQNLENQQQNSENQQQNLENQQQNLEQRNYKFFIIFRIKAECIYWQHRYKIKDFHLRRYNNNNNNNNNTFAFYKGSSFYHIGQNYISIIFDRI